LNHGLGFIVSLVLVALFLFSTNFAFAQGPPSILWEGVGNDGSHGIGDSSVNQIPVQFTVTDDSLANNSIVNKINVLVNSTTDPTGITVTLTENGDTGTFTNTNLIFSNGTGLFGVSSSQTVGINNPLDNTDPNVIETLTVPPLFVNGLQILSTTDTTGIFMNLTETGPNTGIFTNTLHFTSGPSIDGSSISVHPGDIVSIFDLNNLDVINELVTPNSDPALGALSIKFNDEVDAIYNGVKERVFLTSGSAPGGGGGGLIRPGLVLDVLAAIGGSPYIVSPPSFGGGSYHYSDGLTLTQGTDKTTFDTSKYNQEIPTQAMVPGEQVNMTFKTFESYNPTGLIHMGLYLVPYGQDMLTTNSIASIIYDKNSPVEVNDPNHILSDASASMTSNGKFQYTQFSFVPTKSYDKMSFLARAWNDHGYSTDVRIHDDIDAPQASVTLPDGVISYDTFNDLEAALEKDGFYKPHILTHIHDTSSVFNSVPGKVSWLYDTKDKTIALVIEDGSGKVLNVQSETLVPQSIQPQQNFLLGDTYYSHHSLSRNNADELEAAKSIETIKALDLLMQLYGKNYVVQYNFLGKQ